PLCGAVVSTKNTMMVPCMVISERYNSGVITPPAAPAGKIFSSHEACAVGQTRCHRISSDNAIPTSTAARARNQYWIPITLWSRLKTYFRMKLVGAACACACACAAIDSISCRTGLLACHPGDRPGGLSHMRSFHHAFLKPLLVIRLLHHLQKASHLVMAE